MRIQSVFWWKGVKFLKSMTERLIYGEDNQKGTLVCAMSGKVLFGNYLKERKGPLLGTIFNFIPKFKHFDICFILIYSNAAITVSQTCPVLIFCKQRNTTVGPHVKTTSSSAMLSQC
jgi:hypothetical protein